MILLIAYHQECITYYLKILSLYSLLHITYYLNTLSL